MNRAGVVYKAFDPNDERYRSSIVRLLCDAFDESDRIYYMHHIAIVGNSEDTITLVEQLTNKVVAHIQVFHYLLHKEEREKKVAYLYAICTSPRYRGVGLMRRLLPDLFEDLERRGYDYVTLVPAEQSLIPYYEKYGFVMRNKCSPSMVGYRDVKDPVIYPAEETREYLRKMSRLMVHSTGIPISYQPPIGWMYKSLNAQVEHLPPSTKFMIPIL